MFDTPSEEQMRQKNVRYEERSSSSFSSFSSSSSDSDD
jgi:hypothetical protein